MERSECAEILTKLANTKINSIMRYPIKIQDVLKNDILFKTLTSKKEFIKDSFCRFERKYCAGDYNDISAYAYFKKDKIVFVEYDEIYEKKGILKCAEYSAKPLNYWLT